MVTYKNHMIQIYSKKIQLKNDRLKKTSIIITKCCSGLVALVNLNMIDKYR